MCVDTYGPAKMLPSFTYTYCCFEQEQVIDINIQYKLLQSVYPCCLPLSHYSNYRYAYIPICATAPVAVVVRLAGGRRNLRRQFKINFPNRIVQFEYFIRKKLINKIL